MNIQSRLLETTALPTAPVVTARRLCTTKEAAAYLGLSVITLEVARVRGAASKHHALPYIKLGNSVRYHPDDLAAYIAARRINSTSEQVLA
jgi:hypothetical protein